MGHGLRGAAAVGRIAVVGAGYAGMAAAVELAAAGITVHVFEAAPELGGRARAVRLGPSGSGALRLDNGQHILSGAYKETLRLLELLWPEAGAVDELLLRLPLTLIYPGQVSIKAARLPAPLHLGAALLAARGLTAADKIAALRFMRTLKRCEFRLAHDTTVAELLAQQTQPPRLCRYLWEPLCLAALNTPAPIASAQVFANVLRDSLAGKRAASDLLLPRVDLSSLLPERAERFIAARGGRILRRAPVAAIFRDGDGESLSLRLRGETGRGEAYERIIVAVGPQHLGPLSAALPELAPVHRQIEALAWQPIFTCYLAYGGNARLPAPMQGCTGGMAQWLFDHSQLGGQPGLFAAVISAEGPHQTLSGEAVAATIHQEIAAIVPGLQAPLWSRLIREKRATFSCVPGLARPATLTPVRGLLLAGDYLASDYPATLETAVRSGVAAATAALA